MFAFALSPSWLLLSTKGDFVFCKLSFPSMTSGCRFKVMFLLLFWLFGFCLGAYYAWIDRALFSDILSGTGSCNATVLIKFLFFAASFLLPVIAVVLRLRFLLYFLAFMEGVAYAIVVVGLVACNSSGGGLLASLLLFPELPSLLPKLWFWRECFYKTFSNVIFSFLIIVICYIPALAAAKKWIEPTGAVLWGIF